MKLTPGSFSIVPIKMLSGLPANEQVVFMWLCSYANQENQCFPSISTLCEKTSLSKMTLIRILKKLEGKGYISKDERYLNNGGQTSNLYSVNIVDNSSKNNLSSQDYTGGSNFDTPTSNKNDTPPPVSNLDPNYIHNKDLTKTNINQTKNITPCIPLKRGLMIKNNEIDNLISSYTENEELHKVIKEFVKMRKEIKKPMTVKAIELMLRNLSTLAIDDYMKIKIIEQSIMNSWQGIFPLKNNENNKNETNIRINRQRNGYQTTTERAMENLTKIAREIDNGTFGDDIKYSFE